MVLVIHPNAWLIFFAPLAPLRPIWEHWQTHGQTHRLTHLTASCWCCCCFNTYWLGVRRLAGSFIFVLIGQVFFFLPPCSALTAGRWSKKELITEIWNQRSLTPNILLRTYVSATTSLFITLPLLYFVVTKFQVELWIATGLTCVLIVDVGIIIVLFQWIYTVYFLLNVDIYCAPRLLMICSSISFRIVLKLVRP